MRYNVGVVADVCGDFTGISIPVSLHRGEATEEPVAKPNLLKNRRKEKK